MPKPDTATIEKLLRDTLAKEEVEIASLIPYKDAVLIEFDLVSLEQVASSRWHAETEMLVDFGPPPPAVLGFERIRQGSYQLLLTRNGNQLKLRRFTPIGRVHPLPARD